MRWVVLIFGGFLFSFATVAIACSGPGSVTAAAGSTSAGTGGASGGGGTGGAADIDGLQECIEFFTRLWEMCAAGPLDVLIGYECQNLHANIPPSCEDLYDEYYACMNHAVQTIPAEIFCTNGAGYCSRAALAQCRDDHGCQAISCMPYWDTPKGDECICPSWCQDRKLTTDCWFDGEKHFCECSIEDVLVGICEEPAEYVCDWGAPAQSCCNQYFMLPW